MKQTPSTKSRASRFTFPASRFFPWLAALVALGAAWLVPLPALVSGDEQLIAQRMPQSRATIQEARFRFDDFEERYIEYIRSHDLSAVLAGVESAIADARADSSDPIRLAALGVAAKPVLEYARELQSYAAAGEPYLAKIQAYDNDLMAWSRSLGSAVEGLRGETWAFVEHIKRYPPPVGESLDPPLVTAAEAATQTATLADNLAALERGAGGSSEQIINRIEENVTEIWASGRSIEHICGLHGKYNLLLRLYDSKVERAAENVGQGGASSGRAMLATGLNVLVGLVTMGGLGALFMQRGKARA